MGAHGVRSVVVVVVVEVEVEEASEYDDEEEQAGDGDIVVTSGQQCLDDQRPAARASPSCAPRMPHSTSACGAGEVILLGGCPNRTMEEDEEVDYMPGGSLLTQ